MIHHFLFSLILIFILLIIYEKIYITEYLSSGPSLTNDDNTQNNNLQLDNTINDYKKKLNYQKKQYNILFNNFTLQEEELNNTINNYKSQLSNCNNNIDNLEAELSLSTTSKENQENKKKLLSALNLS